ncbi:uncharacterized protein [Argopecten irradians]|uniref:uncharacterized protein n=1 Tax=Argopecten irradians TaxID=31199 RepID=UPI0037153474
MLLMMRGYLVLVVLWKITYQQKLNEICPEGGVMYYGSDYQMCFYVVIETGAILSKKQLACSPYGGIISHIPDSKANSFLYTALSELSNYRFVYGLTDIDVEGVFMTYTGEVQKWINWEKGQPDNTLGGEHCTVCYASGNTLVVNDRLCTFESFHTRVLCHREVLQPDVKSYPLDYLTNGIGDTELFSSVLSPSKGFIGPTLASVVVKSITMCALICMQDYRCHSVVYQSADGTCSTHAIAKINPAVSGSWQEGHDNVWIRR